MPVQGILFAGMGVGAFLGPVVFNRLTPPRLALAPFDLNKPCQAYLAVAQRNTRVFLTAKDCAHQLHKMVRQLYKTTCHLYQMMYLLYNTKCLPYKMTCKLYKVVCQRLANT